MLPISFYFFFYLFLFHFISLFIYVIYVIHFLLYLHCLPYLRSSLSMLRRLRISVSLNNQEFIYSIDAIQRGTYSLGHRVRSIPLFHTENYFVHANTPRIQCRFYCSREFLRTWFVTGRKVSRRVIHITLGKLTSLVHYSRQSSG